jgi:hypothetical protein
MAVGTGIAGVDAAQAATLWLEKPVWQSFSERKANRNDLAFFLTNLRQRRKFPAFSLG